MSIMDKRAFRAHFLLMKTNDRLKTYRGKRDFRRTPEPAGDDEAMKGKARFVVQEHAARRHHYDLRLEINNVLKSWAVPKGPSNDPSEKRLAIATEDHPLEYAEFEGVIPRGEYGAGKMIVWDSGTYRNTTKKSGKAIPIEDAVAHGHISVWLEGTKLKGGFALNRFKKGPQEQWLLVKMRDEQAVSEEDVLNMSPESVLTGRTLEDVGQHEKERADSQVETAVKLTEKLTRTRKRTHDPMPSHIEPMLAVLSTIPTDSESYSFEYKWDGIRVLCYWGGGRLKLESRNKLDITHRWPELTRLGGRLGATPAVLDGEIVVLDAKNRVNFGLLTRRLHLSSAPTKALTRSIPIVYMIFDILFLKERLLIDLPYEKRRSILHELHLSEDKWQTPEPVRENPRVILEAAVENGMEGIVAKRLDSKYRPGHRTPDWLKIKALDRQEFVIGGWIPLKHSVARGVGSLLVGYYDDNDRLIFAGKVGTGFTDASRKDLKERFDNITRKTSPFVNNISDKHVLFVEPELVGEVVFREWTDDGKLRHPVFKGLREDKDPRAIVRERPLSTT